MNPLTADRFQMRIIHEGARDYRILFPREGENPPMPTFDTLIRQWRDKDGKPFPLRDREPKRVGTYSHGKDTFQKDVYQFNCTGISWAHTVLMDEETLKDEKNKKIPPQERFLVVGIGCVIYTKDGKLVINRRAGSDKVKQCPNERHIVGGYADLESAFKTKSLLPTVYKELKEEARIYPKDISMLIPIGAYENTTPGAATLQVGFFCRVLLTAEEVLTHAKKAKDAYEGEFYAYSPAEVRELLKDPDDFVSVTGALLVRILNTKSWKKYSCTRCRKTVPSECARHTLTVVRHGETDWNRYGNRSIGQKDVPLNDTGRRQAREHARKLKERGVPIHHVVYSPLTRASSTASIIANELRAPYLTSDIRLQERCMGVNEGLPSILDWWRCFTDEFNPTGAEPYAEFNKRVGKGFAAIHVMCAPAPTQENVLVVTHGLPIIEFLKQARGLTVDDIKGMQVPSHEDILTFAFGEPCPSCGNLWFEQF